MRPKKRIMCSTRSFEVRMTDNGKRNANLRRSVCRFPIVRLIRVRSPWAVLFLDLVVALPSLWLIPMGCRTAQARSRSSQPPVVAPTSRPRLDPRPEFVFEWMPGFVINGQAPSWNLTVQSGGAVRFYPHGRAFALGWPASCSQAELSEHDQAQLLAPVLALVESGLQQNLCGNGDVGGFFVWVHGRSVDWQYSACSPVREPNPIARTYARLLALVPKLRWRPCDPGV